MFVRQVLKVTTLVMLAVLGTAVAACGSDTGSETQPAPDVTTFTEGDFEELPLYPDSEPIGSRTETDGVVARSYKVRDVTVDMVIAFYDERLQAAGWQRAEPALRENTEHRADFVNDSYRLELSAQPIRAPEDPPTQLQVVQYSLVLHPL
ncbi:MAG: hypothetical protein KY395_03520 [Actinobacteria bacterium]|nr:hypothetical protein [Actinomycetota bacterium]